MIGRQEGCQIRIPIAGISRTHCEVTVQGGAVTVKDLGSSNGTYVNQERVTEQSLAAGDLISIGGQVFLVQVNGEPEEIEAEFLFEDGLPEEESKAGAVAAKSVSKAPAAKVSDDSSMMDFDFDEDDDEQPPL